MYLVAIEVQRVELLICQKYFEKKTIFKNYFFRKRAYYFVLCFQCNFWKLFCKNIFKIVFKTILFSIFKVLLNTAFLAITVGFAVLNVSLRKSSIHPEREFISNNKRRSLTLRTISFALSSQV